MRLYATFLFLIVSLTITAQVRNPYTGEILPFTKIGDHALNDGNFSNYSAQYGLINHMGQSNALPFVLVQRDTANPWLTVLNGGPGRSNLRLSFELDSILKYYNVLIPGYRGIDDRNLESLADLSSDFLKKFISTHRETYGSDKICDDINLIFSELNLKKISLAGHSFGTLVAAEYTSLYPESVDTIFAFSPVQYQKPYPSPIRMKKVFDSIAVALNLKSEIIIQNLKALEKQKNNDVFYMGIISSLYEKNDIESLMSDLYSNSITVSELEDRGTRFLNNKWLFDFGLKFCHIHEFEASENEVFNNITKGFIALIKKYLVEENCIDKHISFANLPIKLFIPKYDFFYNSFADSLYNTCNCGHADIWKRAPELLIE